jgi:aryl-alcohol dehydrogenase-like predicted oxidoreductase
MIMSKVILGTVQFGINYGVNNTTGKPSTKAIFQILDKAKTLGIQELDTAVAYGDAHNILGQYFHFGNNKDSFKIRSKIQTLSNRPQAQINEILKTLNTSKLESLSFHGIEYLLKAMANKKISELLDCTGTLNYGVSLYQNSEIEELNKYQNINVIQLPFNLLDNWSLRKEKIIEAKENGKEVHVRSCFLQGLFFKDTNTITGKLSKLSPNILKVGNIAKKYNMTISELALRYSLSFKEIDKIIFGVDSISQLEENVHHLLKGSLDLEIIDEINLIKIEDPSLLNPGTW